MARLALVNPPQAKACEPPPALPALAGHLRCRGHHVSLYDANLSVQEHLLSAGCLAAAEQELAERGGPAAHRVSARRAARRADALLTSLRGGDAYATPRRYRAAGEALVGALRVVSTARGVQIRPGDFEHPALSPLRTADLLHVFEHPHATGLGPELTDTAERILSNDPSVVGLSLTYLSQALPGFALAGLLRAAGFRGTLVAGGGLISAWADRLRGDSPWFRAWDALVFGPGETALAELLAGRRSAPGLLTAGAGSCPPGAGAAACFAPDPAGLPWGAYLAPGPTLPLADSRGCYWRRCAFCPETAREETGYRPGPAREVIAAVLRARDTVGANRVHFTDEALSPRSLRELARGLGGSGISWYGFARPEPALRRPELARELAAGGCSMLQIGVESASQAVLDALGKGARAAHMGPIVENLAAAGIRTYVYLLFGTPTETAEDAAATAAWTERHGDAITFLNLSLMNLPRGSALEHQPRRYGITGLAPPGDLDLSLYRGFTSTAGRGRKAVRRWLSDLKGLPPVRAALRRVPVGFRSHHAAFVPLADWP